MSQVVRLILLGALRLYRLVISPIFYALGARCRGVQRVGQPGEALDRPVELGEEGEEGQQAAEGDRALRELVDRDAHHDEQTDGLHEAAERLDLVTRGVGTVDGTNGDRAAHKSLRGHDTPGCGSG